MIIKNNQDAIQSYLEDSSNLDGGFADEVAFPRSAEEIAVFLRQCNERGRPVTVSGGRTGTTGSCIPFGGAILSLERMNRILIIGDGYAVVEPGVLIQDLKNAAEKKDYIYPCDPTEQTATVGGTVATNASGATSYKYGATRDFVRRLKIALADGKILDIRRGQYRAQGREFKHPFHIQLPAYKMPKLKHSAGYFVQDNMDLIDLFIGSEGTLGVFAEIELTLVPAPENIISIFGFFTSEEKAIAFSEEARALMPVQIEYFDSYSLELLRGRHPAIPSDTHAAVYVEAETSRKDEDEVLGKWQICLERGGADERHIWVAMTPSQRQGFKDLRHSLPETVNEIVKRNRMPKVTTDCAVPHRHLHAMIDFYKHTFDALGFPYTVFGHIGDDHLHTNLLARTPEERERAREAARLVIQKAVELGGTVSAEHGIGKMRIEYLKMMYGEGALRQMAAVKKTMDPKGALGRGNMFPEDYLGCPTFSN